MPIAPWLQPTDFLSAIRSGAGLGLQVRQQRDAEIQAAETLRQAQESLMQRAIQSQAENELRQQAQMQAAQQAQAENFLKAQQLAQQQQESEALMGLKQNEEQRQQSLFNQGQAFSQLAKSQVLPGGGDFEAMTPNEQQQATSTMQKRNYAELLQNAPPDVLPKLLIQQEAQQNRGSGYSHAALIRLEAQTGIPFLGPNGEVQDPMAYQQAIGKSAELARLGKLTGVQKNADDYRKSVKASNPDITDEQLDAETERYIASGGGSAKAPPDTLKKIEAGDTIIQGLDSALASIEKFNAKFGANAFDQFTGPIEGRIQKLKSRFGNLSAEDEIAARQIWSSIAQVEQAYRQANFGTALTANEINQFKNIVEDPTSTAFIPTVKAFRDTSERILKNQLSVRPYASNIPDVIKQRYSGTGTRLSAEKEARRQELLRKARGE